MLNASDRWSARNNRRCTQLFWLLSFAYIVGVILFAYHWCYRKPYWMRLEMEDWSRDSSSEQSFFWNTTTRVMPRLLTLLFGLTAPCFCCVLYACTHFIRPMPWFATGPESLAHRYTPVGPVSSSSAVDLSRP